MSTERVAIIGGGIAGLAAALALEHGGHDVVILERDPEPPEIEPEAAFEQWARPGVPQFRHAHIFLARAQTLLRDHHPELLAELLDAGLELSNVSDGIADNLLEDFEARPEDRELLHLWGRRATFEYVIRRYVGRLPYVRFVHSVKVVGLRSERSQDALRVTGVEIARGDRPDAHETIEADIVVDASGKRTQAKDWLRELGVDIQVDSRPSGFIYACRHYQLREPERAPSRRDGGGNLDYLGYATFYAEHGHYALTFGCPVEEEELAKAMRGSEGFEALCEQFPVLRKWRALSEAKSKVLGAGRFENRWTTYRTGKGPELLGFFALGDSHIETNPMYGRGCASALVQAEVFKQALAASSDPAARARHYYARCRELLYSYFTISADTDHLYHVRAKLARGQAVPLRDRILNHLYEAAWLPATHSSLLVAREFLKAQQMREVSGLKLRLAMSWHILLALLRSWFGRGRAAVTNAATRPRREFLEAVSTFMRGRGRTY